MLAQLLLAAALSVPPAATAERTVSFVSGGRNTSALLVRPRVPGGPLRGAAILWVHWLGDPATTNHTEFIADARALAAKGATSLLVDAMWAKPKWFETGRAPATDAGDVQRQVTALRRALDVLAASNVDRSRIAYVGHDFGAMYGALLLAADPRPAYAVLMTPTLSFWEWFLLGAQPSDRASYVAAMSRYDLPGPLARTHARATLLQFADNDAYVSGATAAALRNAVPENGRTYRVYPSDHALHVAAATNDRRAWLLRMLTK